MSVLREHYPLGALLKIAGLARSTFYYQMTTAKAGDRHSALKTKIAQVFAHHKGRYGYRRVTATLRQNGTPVNHKTVQRLMLVLRLKSLVHPKKYRSYRGETGRIVPNLLARRFDASQPNEK
ncbi:integrase [Pandoraea horticolens]|uniref:Integrase n=1 Tax=Pandoraea horticolens TaxID=2508298 RepID=A0A5E4T0A5_9BURK|nr:integrase [Pandoraea horticolens]